MTELCYKRYIKNKDTVISRLVDNLEQMGLLFTTTTDPEEPVYICHAICYDEVYYDLLLEQEDGNIKITEVSLNTADNDTACNVLLDVPVNSKDLMDRVEGVVITWSINKSIVINLDALVDLPEILGLVVDTKVEDNCLESSVYVTVNGENRLMELSIASTLDELAVNILDTKTEEDLMTIKFNYLHLSSYKLHNYLASIIGNTRAMLV